MKNKGFTLVELLATMVILAILILIGTMTVSNIFDNSKENYYKSMENTLGIAGNEFFNDNRDDKPIDDYNFVDLKTLQEHEYLEELKTFDGKDLCDDSTGVYIYNDDNGNNYEVCLVCGEYKSKGEFCNGKKFGTINITGNINTPNGPFYNPLLSYSGTSWINASVIYVHFSLNDNDVNVSQYKIYSSTSNTLYGTCNASGNKCSYRMETTGSYYVEAYDGSEKVANRKYFNIKLDGTPPSFDLKNNDPEFELSKDDILYDYENEVININDDNGYRSVIYTLTRYNPTKTDNIEYIAREVDIKDQDLKINHQLESGKYDLYVRVIDFAGNDSNKHISFYIKYRVDLQYYDNKDMKHDVGSLKVYTYGHYDNLPAKINLNNNSQEVDWYQNPQLSGTAIMRVTLVEKTGYHILYGREQKLKTTFGVTCNNLVYNGQNQVLSEIPSSESGKYRLLVYYDGKLMANEAKDARKYTVIAILNSEYIWSDGSKAAKSIQCEIMPKQVPKPSCTDKTYNMQSQKLVSVVDDNGNYAGYGENAYSLGQKPFGINAGDYNYTATLNANMNYSWDGAYDFSPEHLACKINPYKVSAPTSSLCNPDAEYNGGRLVDVLNPIGGAVYNGFDGYSHPFSSDSYSIIGGDFYGECDFTAYQAFWAEAGTWPVFFQLCNDNNYVWSDGSNETKTIYCDVKPKPVAVKWSTDSTHEYDGNEWGRYASVDTGFGDTMSIEVTKATEVGTYSTTATCTGVSGGSYSCDNYKLTNTTSSFKIVDTTKPTCGSASVSTGGTVSFSATDTHDGDMSATEQASGSGTVYHTFKDQAGNSRTCSKSVTYGQNASICGTTQGSCTYNYHCTCSGKNYTQCTGSCRWVQDTEPTCITYTNSCYY